MVHAQDVAKQIRGRDEIGATTGSSLGVKIGRPSAGRQPVAPCSVAATAAFSPAM